MKKQTLIFTLALMLMASLTQAQENPLSKPPGQLIDVGGHQLHFLVRGSGPETVVIEAGTGAWSLTWMDFQEALAKHFRVIIYDRAGYGWSETSPWSRTFDNIAEELHLGLKALGVNQPVVLLGHSFGGLVIRAYLKRYPDEVKALVFADAATPYQFKKLPAAVGQIVRAGRDQFKQAAGMARSGLLTPEHIPIDSTLKPNWWKAYQSSQAQPRFYEALVNEMDLMPRSYEQVMEETAVAQPALIISAGNSFGAFKDIPGMPVKEANQVWQQLQLELLYISQQSKQLTIEDGTHDLLLSVPDRFAQAVIEFVKGL